MPESGFDDLWQAIRDQWPSYLAYTTSFFTIGALWTAHHGLFRRLESADARILHLNLLLLWVVAFLPFPTKLAAEALRHESNDPERAAVLFYGGALLVISIVMTAMTLYAARRRDLLKEGVAAGGAARAEQTHPPDRSLLRPHPAARPRGASGGSLAVPRAGAGKRDRADPVGRAQAERGLVAPGAVRLPAGPWPAHHGRALAGRRPGPGWL